MRNWLVLAVLLLAEVGWAERDREAERAFYEAVGREASDNAGAIDALEALGAAAPSTIWSDDAYVQAARLAEQRGDLARARSNYEKAIGIGGDARLVARAQSELARLTANTGGGQWDHVAASHEQLVTEVYGGSRPAIALAKLEALVTASPGYPRRAAAVLAIAEGWEREGQAERAIRWLSNTRVADPREQQQLEVALIHALIRHREIGRAQRLLATYRTSNTSDPSVVRELDHSLRSTERRQWLRRLALAFLGIAAAIAILDLRRAAGSWRAALRAIRRPPTEVLFLAPVAAVLAVAASTGNVLIAPAVWQILGGGLAVAWISGVLLRIVRTTNGTIGSARVFAHAAAAVMASLAVAYVTLDHQALLDLMGETFAHGPAMR